MLPCDSVPVCKFKSVMKWLSEFNVVKTAWPAQSADLHLEQDLRELGADHRPTSAMLSWLTATTRLQSSSILVESLKAETVQVADYESLWN